MSLKEFLDAHATGKKDDFNSIITEENVESVRFYWSKSSFSKKQWYASVEFRGKGGMSCEKTFREAEFIPLVLKVQKFLSKHL